MPVGDGACPACGGAPVASADRRLEGRARHALLRLLAVRDAVERTCASNACSASSTKGIAYQELEGGPDTVKAETCDELPRLREDPAAGQGPGLDPVADDVATLGLDMLVRESGYRRGAVNPFLLGY